MAIMAHVWLERGWRVVPIQPNSKRLVQGYGPHLESLDPDQVDKWFSGGKFNLGVVGSGNCWILDFDSADLYYGVCKRSPKIRDLYTEGTPASGFHVFTETVDPITRADVSLADGLELLRLAVVYPSRVIGGIYQPLGGQFCKVDLQEALAGFAAFATVKHTSSPLSALPGALQGQPGGDFGLVASTKRAWPILRFLAFVSPMTTRSLRGAGRWRVALCPWHDDHEPSLWVDVERNLWGCHACGAHGDVISWWAMTKGLSQGQAALDLIRRAESVRFSNDRPLSLGI